MPPGFAAAAAHAAAECAHRHGMPALAALLQRALAAARAAVAAAAAGRQAAGAALEEAGCSKAKLLAAGGCWLCIVSPWGCYPAEWS